jgi:hypothetical protein
MKSLELLVFVLAFLTGGQVFAQSESDAAPAPHQVYSHLLAPREHPDDARRSVQPPSWETFGNRTQFMALRGFQVNEADQTIVDYVKEIDRYTKDNDLGDVIWPSYPIMFAKNLGDLADEIKRRNLYLFDVWGYVPGSGPGGYWQQFKPSPDAFALLESKLGERWLGMDVGEQDGRYIGGYAGEMTPASADRFHQYLNFQRHFERMGNDLGNKLSTLVSLNFGHYFLKEGTYTMIGAETAQGLPNNQIYYAFIRGAGKQYGVPWFGNASIYNRWGYKNYDASGTDGYNFGVMKGTSLSLMKRLIYSHILYNSMAVGFEAGWFHKDQLTPIGHIQQSAQRWVKEHGQPGVMHTPVALLLDFYSGWSFPRHLYTSNVYRVWGNLPYAQGDYLTDAVLDMLYPGYQDSSYFHNESGFITPTPYGDIADCILTDASSWLLARYPVVVVAGEVAGGAELRDKLQAYAQNGGHLALTEGNLAKLPGLTSTPLHVGETIACGKGKITLFAGDFGVDLKKDLPNGALASKDDQPLAKPYELCPEARKKLDEIFREQQLFAADAPSLSLITCRKSAGEYLVGVLNNGWQESPLKIVSHCGPIVSIQELILDQSEQKVPEYFPEGVDSKAKGINSETTIVGGDVRIFAVRVKETNVTEIAHVAPPARPIHQALPLRDITSIKEAVLAQPTFFEHWDGVIIDWRYLHDREKAALQQEAGWIKRQGLQVYVDLRPGLNLYPDLRLVENDPAEYAASMAAVTDVLQKMPLLGAHDLILRLHRHPENNITTPQVGESERKTLSALAQQAEASHVTLHLRSEDLKSTNWLIDALRAKNIRIAACLATLSQNAAPSKESAEILNAKLGLWLVAGQRKDAAGTVWDNHTPLRQIESLDNLAKWIALVPDAPKVLDTIDANATQQNGTHDEEYLDAVALKQINEKTNATSH